MNGVSSYLVAAVVGLAHLRAWSGGPGVRALGCMTPEWRTRALQCSFDILSGLRTADAKWVTQ